MARPPVNRTSRNRAARARKAERTLLDRKHSKSEDGGTSTTQWITAGTAIASVLVAIVTAIVGYWAWVTSADALRNAELANQLAYRAAQYANWPVLDVEIDRTNMSMTVINKGTGVANIYFPGSGPWVGPPTSGSSLERGQTNFAKPASWITTPETTPLMSRANYAGYVRFDRIGTLIAAGERKVVFELDYDGFAKFMNDPETPNANIRSAMQIEFDMVLNKISFGLCYTDLSVSRVASVAHNPNGPPDCDAEMKKFLAYSGS